MATQTVDNPVTATMFTRKMGEAMRQQSVCIEIPVTIQGSRLASGDSNNSNATKTFIEESRTMIVFPMGAVVRFSEPVSEGQVLILKNLRMNREVACRVVCSKTSANVKGFVEVEFVQPADGFGGSVSLPYRQVLKPPRTPKAPGRPRRAVCSKCRRCLRENRTLFPM
jgi:hypothetical protein